MEKKRLHKNMQDKKICGVCSGIADYLGIDPTIVRVLWAILVLCFGFGFIAYFVCAFIFPADNEQVVDNIKPQEKEFVYKEVKPEEVINKDDLNK